MARWAPTSVASWVGLSDEPPVLPSSFMLRSSKATHKSTPQGIIGHKRRLAAHGAGEHLGRHLRPSVRWFLLLQRQPRRHHWYLAKDGRLCGYATIP
jgi:hypothetical protein